MHLGGIGLTGLKRGKVQYRVKGRTKDPGPAYQAARDYCARKNAKEAA